MQKTFLNHFPVFRMRDTMQWSLQQKSAGCFLLKGKADTMANHESKTLAGNTATSYLKWIALLCMFCDHAGKMLFPQITELRIIGRIAYPLYCWCLVVGVSYTHSVPMYMLRLLVVGVISQPLYMLALDHEWNEPNIFLTLLLALVGLWGMREKKLGSAVWAPLVTLVLASPLNANYGWKGILLIYLLYMVRGSRTGISAVMIAFCLFWGSTSSQVSQIFSLNLSTFLHPWVQPLLTPWMRLQALAILALPLMLIRMKGSVKMPLWLSYTIYPLHLAILYLWEQLA